MKIVLQQHSLLLLGAMIVLFIAGCYQTPIEVTLNEAQETIREARKYYDEFEYVGKSTEEESFSQDIDQARTWLLRAEEYFEEKHLSQAILSAVKSAMISRQKVEQFYGPTLEETQEILKETRECYDEIQYVKKRAGDKQKYSQKIALAGTWLLRAEEHLNRERLNQAVLSAMKSTAVSRTVVNEFYAKDFPEYIEQVRQSIRERIDRDAEDISKDFFQQLDATLKDIKEVSRDYQYIEALRDMNKVDVIKKTVDHIQMEEIESDISFDEGEYALSDKGKQNLQEFIEKKIIIDKETLANQYPDETIIIKIKTVGYTDEVTVKPGKTLYRELIKGVEDKVPQTGIERRKFLNQRLSEFRAREIAEYIEQRIRETDPENSLLQLEFETLGLGQEIPPDVDPPYPQDDSRRRICKIYSYVSLK